MERNGQDRLNGCVTFVATLVFGAGVLFGSLGCSKSAGPDSKAIADFPFTEGSASAAWSGNLPDTNALSMSIRLDLVKKRSEIDRLEKVG